MIYGLKEAFEMKPCGLSCAPLQMCSQLKGVFVGPACQPRLDPVGPYIPDVLFWSVILFFTTFFLSAFLKQFKTKRYFPTKVQQHPYRV